MCTQASAGYIATDGQGSLTGVNTAAVDQDSVLWALSLQPEPQRAQQRRSTVDANGDTVQGAVAEAQQKKAFSRLTRTMLAISSRGLLHGDYFGRHAATAAGAVDEAQHGGSRPMMLRKTAGRRTCASGYYSSAGATVCTQVDAGYFAEDGSGNSVNTAAVDQDLSLGHVLQPEPQRAQQRSRDTTRSTPSDALSTRGVQ